MKQLSRRDFIKLSGAAAGVTAASLLANNSFAFLQPIPIIDNPLAFYPDRDWEQAYRNLSRVDSTFVFLCAPNDTHNCLLKANVRHGAMTRIDATYRYGEAVDVYGNRTSARWNPRYCNKGQALVRKVYGDRRVKGAFVRKGFMDWAGAGYPREADGRVPASYLKRGLDEYVKVEWDKAFELVAKTFVNIAQTYGGPDGAKKLLAQGYDPDMVEAMHEAGTQTLKHRGGMPFLGATRIFGLNRVANMLALLDANVRKVDAEHALGARAWDSYSWHTDLPPGHPMVTGQQTVEFDLFTAENAKLITLWGMNWISTKMPDGHWLTEARLRGAKIITIATEYQSTSCKADEVLVIRPGTDTALALGLAHVILRDKLYDVDFVKTFTDLPFLVRMDTLKLLGAADVIPGYRMPALENYVKVLKPEDKAAPNYQQGEQIITEVQRKAWGDFVVWDARRNAPAAVTRDHVGQYFARLGIDPTLEGTFKVTMTDGKQVEVRSIFDLEKAYLAEFTPENVSQLTWAPQEAILSLAKQIAENKKATLLAHGMGPNHFFNNDLKDRAIFLVSALTANIGYLGGSPGSYAGNYRTALFNGMPQYIIEDPFNIELDPAKPAKTRSLAKYESAHYYNYGDRPLRVGNKQFTGKTHMPTPTKSAWFANSNSILGNSKWAYDIIVNTLPKMDMVVANEWWWTMTCEYADVVFGVDSWAELKYPDMCGSVTNPFLSIFPRTPLQRLFDTRGDIETYAGVGAALARATGDKRFEDYWRFVLDNRVDVYLQRIVDHSTALRGYNFAELEARAKEGIPSLKMLRTYPKIVGWEQTQESKPWYTRTGRLEFYRDEPEFIEYGENLSVHREPVDATFYEPNVIVSAPHPALKPAQPEQYGLKRENQSTEVRQVRNVVLNIQDVLVSKHPLTQDGYSFLFITPKYRHGVHTTPVDIAITSAFFGPFGDMYRHDKRSPWTGESYVDMNPADAKSLGIEDGDYVWIDADPSDRPFRGWQTKPADYKVMRMMTRARYYNGMPRGILRMWFHMYQATHGSVEAHESRPDGLAKNPRTGYQAMFRYGGHQSATRAWLRPTLMTDSLTRKDVFGQVIGQGFAADVHCTVGAPKESFVKITKAEAGGLGGKGVWRPAALGLRAGYESQAMQDFLAGKFISIK